LTEIVAASRSAIRVPASLCSDDIRLINPSMWQR
jgi:hypothetical protein